MPRNSSPLRRADVKAMVDLLISIGKTPTALKVHPDGTFRVMTSEHISKEAAAAAPNEWDAVLP